MAYNQPVNADTRLGINITQPANSAEVPIGIAVSCDPGADPRVSTIATRGFFGVLAQAIPANTTAAAKVTRVACTVQQTEEVLLAANVTTVGTPLTIDSDNRWSPATTGERIDARAMTTGLANTRIVAKLGFEGVAA
jgi:hypothetical protein